LRHESAGPQAIAHRHEVFARVERADAGPPRNEQVGHDHVESIVGVAKVVPGVVYDDAAAWILVYAAIGAPEVAGAGFGHFRHDLDQRDRVHVVGERRTGTDSRRRSDEGDLLRTAVEQKR